MKRVYVKLEEIDLEALLTGEEVVMVNSHSEVHIILADIGMDRITTVFTKANWKYRSEQNDNN